MNEQVEIVFPDGRKANYRKGISLAEIAESISPSLAKRVVVGSFNGKLLDLRAEINADGAVALFDLDSNEGIDVMRHSLAHVMAQAVKRLYSQVDFGIGPVIENGFYYDFDLEESLSEADLAAIEREMAAIIAEDLRFERFEVSKEKALEIFADQPLKLELIEEISQHESLSIYKQGEFVDLCRGPHLPSTKYVKAFNLRRVSGAYWRGDSDNKMLQRIYGVAFKDQRDLEDYFTFLDEAKKRNHRKIGNEMDLFMFSEEAPGMPFYLENGQIIRNELESYLRKVQTFHDYREVKTPLLMNQRLWERSGHWDHYKDNMYFSKVDGQDFALKPMNCPGHMLIFKDKLRSYRDLPIRIAEFGQVHRHEFSGALNGLLRVRSFCQDDAHIFVRRDQIQAEISLAMKLIDELYQTFGFEYHVELSTRPEDHMGSDALWDEAEAALANVLESMDYDYKVNEGDGAFYGPKIDIHIKDALGRSHQCGTVQLDYQMPEKFDLTYVDANAEKVRPVVIHRAIFGSLDRFLGILIEHFAGAFPYWLAPVQAEILPVSYEAHGEYAEEIKQALKLAGIRVQADFREEKLGYKMREAQMRKIPFILVVGDKERDSGSVSVREYGSEQVEEMQLADFTRKLAGLIEAKSLLHSN
ncbi:threonyl-tRNA ligase [Listeria floridensis FSL S10-1187]|uniref:Threonine--tRNA ligase n=1 Tax=Listeria floridensis FSL S10-1187 TaxID=1265817 RepID=A0ABP3AU50_9LIST|nr:threonine--tRNA ligase [Listeria floridensis]EUJ25733.1 threonyl-tRNA ligase [Listeria floridensis FSL S10-1187]